MQGRFPNPPPHDHPRAPRASPPPTRERRHKPGNSVAVCFSDAVYVRWQGQVSLSSLPDAAILVRLLLELKRPALFLWRWLSREIIQFLLSACTISERKNTDKRCFGRERAAGDTKPTEAGKRGAGGGGGRANIGMQGMGGAGGKSKTLQVCSRGKTRRGRPVDVRNRLDFGEEKGGKGKTPATTQQGEDNSNKTATQQQRAWHNGARLGLARLQRNGPS